jgi:hypothetical protein
MQILLDCTSSTKQAASKCGLQVTAPVCNEVNNNLIAYETVDDAVRLKESLAVFFETKTDRFERGPITRASGGRRLKSLPTSL